MLETAEATIDQARLSFLRWLVEEEQARQDNYRTYREYYDGVHSAQLTDRQRKYLQVKAGEEFRLNYCPVVVDSLCEKLSVTGFDADAQSELLWEWWTANRMDGVQGSIHLAAVRDGDAYLMVEWDNERGLPVFSYEEAACDGEGVKLVYSDERNVPLCATKRWRVKSGDGVGDVRRLNVYYPDRIEKFVSRSSAFEGDWQPYQEPGQPWPIPWLDKASQPLGVPVVHFRNKNQGYNYGVSELADVLSIQNALNKSMLDLLAAADTTAFRIFWMIGDDPSGLTVAPGSWVYSSHPPAGEDGAAVGYFPGEDLSKLIALKDSVAMEIARVTRTPISYFQISAQRAAEGTLKQEESGIVGKAKERQVSFGNAWEDALAIARRLWNTWGPGPEMDGAQSISTVWQDPQSRNEKEHLEGLELKMKLGVPKKQLWREAGYNDSQIADMEQMEEEAEAATGSLGERLLRAFERGTPTAQTPEAGEA